MIYTAILEKIGLTSNEALAYQTLLKLHDATPSLIAKESGLSRANTYQVMYRLETLDLVRKKDNSLKQEYSINPPDKLLELLEKNEKQVRDSKSELKKFIKLIDEKINLTYSRPVVKFVQNQEEIKLTFLDFLDTATSDTLYGLINRTSDSFFKNWIFNEFLKERVKRKISLKLLVTDKIGISDLLKSDKKDLRETKIVNDVKFPDGTYICIDKNKVLFVSINYKSEQNIAIVINQPFIAEAVRCLHNLVWES